MSYDPKLWEDFPKTEQECFDRVAEHLLTQNCQAKNHLGGGCVYRDVQGRRCAAGCLIPDKAYSAKFENNDWFTLSHRSIVPAAHMELISLLQYIHDHSLESHWKKRLKKLASERQLEWKFENFGKENISV